METRRPRRKQLTPTQRKQVLVDYHRSELPQKEFALKAGVGVSTLGLWLRRQRAATKGTTTFVEVPNLLPKPATGGGYRIRLVSGAVLEIASDYRAEELGPLLELLKVV